MTFCQELESVLDGHKALDPIAIDLEGKSSIADYLLIATGTSQRHLNALATYAQEHAKKKGIKGTTIEGSNASGWVILDLGNVIIHLFLKEARDLYKLESMWDPALYERPAP